MNSEGKAVFLSYAREDADAARRIAEALRAAGIEAWFDQSDLRGGDVWDANIRRQILSCALFVPIISAHTEARREGYFRREWKMAVDRLQDIAEGIPFIVPVCLDDTRDRTALVPDAFRRAQWTRLRGGDGAREFADRVGQLLGFGMGHTVEFHSASSPGTGPRTTDPSASIRAGHGKWLVAVGILAVVAVVGFFTLRKKPPSMVSNPELRTQNPEPKGARVVDSKSIAVLPFANLSDDKDASAFFSDGIHEDILTNLSNLRELRVVSRTSVLGYRGTTKKMAEIAKELGVAYILEGSVRRAGNKVRVTGQLIRATTDEHLWAKNYDRDLTDIFAIQSELSQAIAGELKAAISPAEKKLLEQRPTQNIAAYELVLKARQMRDLATLNSLDGPPGVAERERLLLAALQLDPDYALAHVELAFLYLADGQYFEGKKRLPEANAAIQRATQLAPDLPELIRLRGDFLYYGERTYDRALEQYERFVVIRPNDPALLNRIGAIQRRQHRYTESLKTWRALEQVDPANGRNVRDIAVLLTAGRRFDEAIAQARRVVGMADTLRSRFELARLSFLASGSIKEADAVFAGISLEALKTPDELDTRLQWAVLRGDADEAIRLERHAAAENPLVPHLAAMYLIRGDHNAARRRLEPFVGAYRARMAEPFVAFEAEAYGWADIAVAEAMLGNKDEALRRVEQAITSYSEARDSLIGANLRAIRAIVLAWTGDKDGALAELAHALRTPYGYPGRGAGSYSDLTVHTLRVDARFAPLRDDPRFEALLKDPKNHERLF